MGRWAMGRGLCVMHLRSPYKINTSDIHVHSIYAFSNSTELNYQLSLIFHFTSKFVVLTEKNPRRFTSVVIQGVTLTLIAIIIMVHNG